jgi:hypothetical protein
MGMGTAEITLEDGPTRLDLLRAMQKKYPYPKREYPQTTETVLEAMRAGRQEAYEATQRSGIDFLSLYEDMCRKMTKRLINR